MGSGGIATCIYNPSTGWRWPASCSSRFISGKKSHLHPMLRRLGGLQSWSGRGDE